MGGLPLQQREHATMMEFKDKVAWVTGAGSGVGRSTALLLAGQGAKVALLGRREETVIAALEGLGEGGEDCVAKQLDVGDRNQVGKVSGELLAEWGRVDILVNNAALNVPKRRFHEVDDEDFDGMVRTNLMGPYNMIQAVLPPMRVQGGGSIINVSSMAGKQAHPMSGPGYCSSKFGLIGLSHTVNVEEWLHGIRSTALCPGEINTPFMARRSIVPGEEEKLHMLQPEDVAEAISFIAGLHPRCSVPEFSLVPSRPRAPLSGETI